jgi:hypothetical protein
MRAVVPGLRNQLLPLILIALHGSSTAFTLDAPDEPLALLPDFSAAGPVIALQTKTAGWQHARLRRCVVAAASSPDHTTIGPYGFEGPGADGLPLLGACNAEKEALRVTLGRLMRACRDACDESPSTSWHPDENCVKDCAESRMSPFIHDLTGTGEAADDGNEELAEGEDDSKPSTQDRDCDDGGPWRCGEENCPSGGYVDCDTLAAACHLTARRIWKSPPVQQGWHSNETVAEHCPRSCGSCRPSGMAATAALAPASRAPSALPARAGCLSPASLAVVASSFSSSNASGEFLRGDGETAVAVRLRVAPPEERAEWGVLWAQVACRQPHATHILLEGHAEDGGRPQHLKVPPGSQPRWRPLALVRGDVIGLQTSSKDCAIEWVYKGSGHPAAAQICAWAQRSTTKPPPLLRRPPAAWYALPPSISWPGPSLHFDPALARWLVRIFSGRAFQLDAPRTPYEVGRLDTGGVVDTRADAAGAQPQGAASVEGVGEPPGWTTSECAFEQCSAKLASCYGLPRCRLALGRFFDETEDKLVRRAASWRDYLQRARRHSPAPSVLRALNESVACFMERCVCAATRTGGGGARIAAGALLHADVDAVIALARSIGQSERRKFGENRFVDRVIADAGRQRAKPTGDLATRTPTSEPPRHAQGHNVTYLHGRFQQELPSLYDRLVHLALNADAALGWNLLDRKRMTPHTIEYLEYASVDDSLGWHIDEQSTVTLLALLTDAEHFDGGELQHLVDSSEVVTASLKRRGDVAVYRAHQPHRVLPLRSGRRRALAIEWWHVPGLDYTSEGVSSERVEHVPSAGIGGCPQ